MDASPPKSRRPRDEAAHSHYEVTCAREASEVLTKLNKAWHEDFQRHQARQARR
jgi:hypothetical protein